MPSLEEKFNWHEGIIWKVVFLNPEDSTITPSEIIIGKKFFCEALVDTGATSTCISRKVVEALDLKSEEKTSLITAKGTVETNIYEVTIGLISSLEITEEGLEGEFHITDRTVNIEAVEFDPGISRYGGLIGMDILSMGTLTLTKNGHCSFSFK
jgi:hypothetical protein